MSINKKKFTSLDLYSESDGLVEQVKDKGVLNQNDLWKSLDQYKKEPESIEKKKHEFQNGVTAEFDVNSMQGNSRRKFMAVLGASAAVVATACTDYRDKGEVISYNKQPEGVVYGQANHYASALNDGSGILIKTREGRPIKIDGNPEHPINKGKISSIGQAEIMNLYDPARLKDPIDNKNNKQKLSWQDADAKITEALNKASSSGKEIAIVTNSVISPTQKKLLDDFKAKHRTTRVYQYDLFNNMNRADAWYSVYNSKAVPSIKWDKAKTILALESDFLGTDDNHIQNTALFAKTRNVEDLKNFSRLYAVESAMSLTGSNADYRMRLTPEFQASFVMGLINELINKKRYSAVEIPGLAAKVRSYDVHKIAEEAGMDKKKLDYLIEDLYKTKDKTFVHAGDTLPVEVHIAVNLLNEVLGSARNMYDMSRTATTENKNNIKNLVSDLNSGRVGVLIHMDSDPAFHLAPEYNYSEAAAKAETVVSLLVSENDSSVLGTYTLPVNHALESWNDFKVKSGVLTLQQPVIAPIFNTRQKEAILLNWMSGNPENYTEDIYHKYLQKRWENEVYPASGAAAGFKEYWFSCIHDGYFQWDEMPETEMMINPASVSSLRPSKQKSGFTVVMSKSYFIGDGRYAGNGWLQEIPHPISKVVWDNYAAVAPATAKELGVDYKDNKSDFISVNINGRTLELPVVTQPGMAENVINVELGYGRKVAGEIGSGVGFKAQTLMGNDGITEWIYTGAEVTKGTGKYMLVSTQEHHSLDDDFVKDFHRIRRIVQEATIEEYQKDKNVIKDQALMSTKDVNKKMVNPPKEYNDVKWGMAIDLNKCTGCNECVSACNVENNIPVVGKEQVSKGREMHWIRMDRYYSGSPEDPIVSHQAMACQHCDNAPCENVCPVVATTHSPDGLNQMTYNRCVGTRYCANNCPYKVRRFNFFDFRHYIKDGYQAKESFDLMQNPEVTVRSRGVMEKCTFCVQRIMESRSNAKRDGEKFVGQNVTTACQDACPASAIEFGNLNDPDTKVAKLRKHDLTYRVLEVLGVKPNINYIAKLRNIHTEAEHSEHHH